MIGIDEVESPCEEMINGMVAIKTPENLRQHWIGKGLLDDFSGNLQGYGLIQIDGNGVMTNNSWDFSFEDAFNSVERAKQFSNAMEGYCNVSRLHSKEPPESYAFYVCADNDTRLFATKNSQSPGWGRKMIKEFERMSKERGSQHTTLMSVRPKLDKYVKRLGYEAFRVSVQDGISNKCYMRLE